ncbi:MAG: phytanoyl-CoA dioxygenase family protein, partial [Spirochaetia bacterium]|nr:phytanoyl-CoA dioxygenase family protein [Spirochaetia bacterium]
LLGSPPALRERGARDGYLYLKNILDPEALLAIRRQVLEVCDRHGWLEPGKPLMNGMSRPGFFAVESNAPEWLGLYREVQKIRDLHALALNAALIDVFRKLFDETVLTHSRNICRIIFPHSEKFTTPPHQDFWHIQGTPETWTCWAPLGDCPRELGGLAILPGSHKGGVLESKEAYGAGGRGIETNPKALWHNNEMSSGDVLLFHSLTVHQGMDNRTSDRLRLSLDYRYQPLSQPVRADSLLPHGRKNSEGEQVWEEVYGEWPTADGLKYYWRGLPIQLLPIK